MLSEMHKTWLEVALNGAWGRDRQPRIPIRIRDIVDEGIACAREGAAIVHVHAYDEASGRPHDSTDVYARIIEGIREAVDCIVYPTIPFEAGGRPEERFAAIEGLGKKKLLEWAVVDPGSLNLDEALYLNPVDHVRHGLALARRFAFHPGYAIYEAGFLRLGAALAREIGVPQPIYRFMFSQGLRFGFPPTEYALDAYLHLLADEAGEGAPWMVAGLTVDVLALAPTVVERGGHLRVGLEDAPLRSTRSNVEWVRAARDAIERSGGELASAAEVRAALS
jgi:uncharacterized protein (DUF849 family)